MIGRPKRLAFMPGCILAVILLSSCAGAKSASYETWSLVKVLSQGERTDVLPEVVEVRNCGGLRERKEVECSTGTWQSMAMSLGGGVEFGEVLSGRVDVSVSDELGVGRGSATSLPLESPPDGMVYRYTLKKKYQVIAGELLLQSSQGNEEEVTYAFRTSCDISIDNLEELGCAEGGSPVATTPVEAATLPGPSGEEPLPAPPRHLGTDITFVVDAKMTWQDTGILVNEGDLLQIEYVSGKWTGRYGDGSLTGPDAGAMPGNTDECFPVSGEGSSLIGRVGGGVPFKVGYEYSSMAEESGNLHLRMNDCDGWLYDNYGSIEAEVSLSR